MKKLLMATAVAAVAGVMSAPATLLIDVDGAAGWDISGATHTFEANEGAGGMPNTGGRFKSVTLSGTDRTAITGTDTAKVDYYLQWGGISPSALDADVYRYAKIEYSLSGDWAAGVHKFRLGDTVTHTASAGDNDPFSNPELLDTVAARADGTHSFIVDLRADAGITYAGDWQYLRWNFYNSSDNTSSVDTSNEQALTIDKITFATAVIPEPATLGLVAVFGGGVLFVRRRFRI